MSKEKKIAITTLGCKLNYAESSAIVNSFLKKGFRPADKNEEADLVIIHTCSVTNNANQKCRQTIRKVIKESPNSYVAVVGCYAQLEPEKLASIEGVDLVLGTKEKFNLGEYIPEHLEKKTSSEVFVSNIEDVDAFGIGHSIAGQNGHDFRTRAFLKIQDGCDYCCAFCTIPKARGKRRSQSLKETIFQAEQLTQSGFREIVLTGVNIGEYGSEIGTSLRDLVAELSKVAVPRIRISSIEPNLLHSDLITEIAKSSNVVPHFHVPLQSGSDTILKHMKRRYNTSTYRKRILEAVNTIPDCSIGADVIVGYPGEEERHFDEALDFIETLPISYLHVFSFSRRPNTLIDDLIRSKQVREVPHDIKKQRSKRLQELSDYKKTAFLKKYMGQTLDVLFEENYSRNNEQDWLCLGHTANYITVGVKIPSKNWAKENFIGKIKPVKLNAINQQFIVEAEIPNL